MEVAKLLLPNYRGLNFICFWREHPVRLRTALEFRNNKKLLIAPLTNTANNHRLSPLQSQSDIDQTQAAYVVCFLCVCLGWVLALAQRSWHVRNKRCTALTKPKLWHHLQATPLPYACLCLTVSSLRRLEEPVVLYSLKVLSVAIL